MIAEDHVVTINNRRPYQTIGRHQPNRVFPFGEWLWRSSNDPTSAARTESNTRRPKLRANERPPVIGVSMNVPNSALAINAASG
jgi:hypothetical protein